jgi:hypothetical protein
MQRILYKKAIHALLTGRPPIFRKIIARKHRNPCAGEILLHFLGKLNAIHPGQTHIRKDEVRRRPVDSLQGLFPVSYLLNNYRRYAFMKTRAKRFPKETIVFNDQCSQHISSRIQNLKTYSNFDNPLQFNDF